MPCTSGREVAGEQPTERDLAVRVDSRLNVSALCPRSQEDKLHPGRQQTQHTQTVKTGDYPAVFSASVASP